MIEAPPVVLLLDFDGVICDNRGPVAQRKINHRAMKRVAELVDTDYKLAFITGREASQLAGPGSLIDSMNRLGIADKVPVVASRGLCFVHPDSSPQGYHVELTLEGMAFMRNRKYVAHEVEEAVKRYNNEVRADPRIAPRRKEEHIVGIQPWPKDSGFLQMWYQPFVKGKYRLTDNDVTHLDYVLRRAANKLEIKYGIKVDVMRVGNEGISMLPKALSKAVGAENALDRLVPARKVKLLEGKRPAKAFFIGRAIGDSPEDIDMARHKRLKFVHVKNPEDFLKVTRAMSLRMLHQLGTRPITAALRWNLRKARRAFRAPK